MILLIWIYAVIFTCCVVAGQTNNLKNKNKSIWKPQRINSKMSRGFLTRDLQKQRMLPWIEFLRKIQKRTNTDDNSNEITDELDPKIVNGRPAAEKEFRWMVALHFNGRFVCSAFLISPTIVMTAAHCVKFEDGVEPASAFYGIVGNLRRAGPDTRVDFVEVAAHPSYGTGSENDIAVLRTTAAVAMTDYIEAICLPTEGREIDLVYIQAMGWGATSGEIPEAPEVLMTTELGIVPKSACQFMFALLGIAISDLHLCANSLKPTGVCFVSTSVSHFGIKVYIPSLTVQRAGDSGGPGVYDDPSSGRKVAVGVASFITFLGCGRPLVPNVYTRTASYIDWLSETVVDTSDICFV